MPQTLKTSFRILIGLFCVFVFVLSCSRKKDKFLNRNFHAMGTKYNVLYNGNIALEQGRQSIDDAFTDNYWELLSVERMEDTDAIFLPGQSKNQDFQSAEDKAIKAVQTHSMNINGRERNPQIDEAYLLLGKARYFDQRFVPALEAFNYILFKYPESDKINTAKIWREKTNIRLDNNEVAIKNLKRLLDQENLATQDLADATAMLGQAYINIKAKDSALTQLKVAAKHTKKPKEQARYNYIIGQLYNQFGLKDSANLAFDKIIEMHRKIPRAYYVNAHLEKVKNFDINSADIAAFEDYLTQLEENRENRPFLDKIYYRIAQYYRSNKADSLAWRYYNKSLRVSTQDQLLHVKNYTALGDMSFSGAHYKAAGAYYDSTLVNMAANTKPYRIIERKRNNLQDVIFYEDIAARNDSILHLVGLSKQEQLAYFTTYTEQLKAKADLAAEKQEIAERFNSGLATTPPNTTLSYPPSVGSNSPSFYFYNAATVAYGKNEFTRIWGNRTLKDNWRLSNTDASPLPGQNDVVSETSLNNDQRYDPEAYRALLPTAQTEIDSIVKERNDAYYQLGVIYKEKFKEYELAKNKLLTLIESNPEPRLIPAAKYNLFKIYEETNAEASANKVKNDLVSNYPKTRYAEILLNPTDAIALEEHSPENRYQQLYEQFENQDYQTVINKANEYITAFEGAPIVPKLELLKVSAAGRLKGFEAYKEGLNFLSLNYPNSQEGKQAQEILKSVIPVLENKTFKDNQEANGFKAVFVFDNTNIDTVNAFAKSLNEGVSKLKHTKLTTSVDVYTLTTTFVVVHGFNSLEGAKSLAQQLKEQNHQLQKDYLAVASPNYAIIQIHKNLNQYTDAQ